MGSGRPQPVANRLECALKCPVGHVAEHLPQAIRAFGGLPFGSRDLVAHLPFKAVSDSLNALSRDDQLMVYPPLCEKKGELVAQFEHTLLITDSGVEVLTASEDALRTPLSV